MDIFKVILTKPAKRALLKMPLHIVRKLQSWIDDVEDTGLSEARKIPGYHDEPLKRQNRTKINSVKQSLSSYLYSRSRRKN